MSNKVKKIMKSEEKVTEEKVRENWDVSIKGIDILLNAQLRSFDRTDYLFELKHRWVAVNGEMDVPSVDYFKSVAEMSKGVVETIIGIVAEQTFEDYCKALPTDLLTKPILMDKIEDWTSAYEDAIAWEVLRPFGEKLEQLNKLVMEQMELVA